MSDELLHDIQARLMRLDDRLANLQAEVAKLNGLPERVRKLEQWRAGIAAVMSAVVLAIGGLLTWRPWEK